MEAAFKIVSYGTKDWKEAVKLREEILRKPLGFSFTNEELEAEKNHIHIIGLVENKIIATAVLVPDSMNIKMQRVVVANQLRNLNIGSEMMVFCESYAKDEGYNSVYCHARNSAVKFYLKNGYSADGDYFDEDGIPHLKMKKTLAKH